mgnify:CR=1 FL=1
MISTILLVIALVVIGFLIYALITKTKCPPSSTVMSETRPSSTSTLSPFSNENLESEADGLFNLALETTKTARQQSGDPKTENDLQSVGIDDVLVISLDNSPRWTTHTLKNLENGGFARNNYRRWRGVRGTSLPESTVNQLTTPNRQYLIGCEEHQRIGKIDSSQFSLGAVGCALSHWAAWYHVATNDNIRAALVLEDDVYFKTNDAPLRIASLVAEAGGVDNFDFLRLDPYPSAKNHNMCFRSSKFTQNLDRELGLTYHFTGYVVTKRGARKLLHRALPLYEHIDHHPSYLADIYPDEFLALMLGKGKSFMRQNRLIPSTIRT